MLLLYIFFVNRIKGSILVEKTLITHSCKEVRFLGYNVKVRRNQEIFKVKGPTKNYTKRKLNNMVELGIPLDDKITKFLFEKGVIKQKDGKISPKRRQNFFSILVRDRATNKIVRSLEGKPKHRLQPRECSLHGTDGELQCQRAGG